VGVPSSTSSSDSSKDRAPEGRWALSWAVAVALLVIALAGWKVAWTSRGYGVSLTNNAASWAAKRVELRPGSTVLLGTSRTQAGIVPKEWADTVGGEPPLQLALLGTSPVRALEYLAEETDFRGLAVVGVVDMYVFDAEATGEHVDEAIAEYRAVETGPARRSGVALQHIIPGSLLMRNQHLTLGGVLESMWKRSAPKNSPANMQPDRWIEFVRDRLRPEDIDYTEFENAGRPATVAERDSIIADIRACIETIRARGGAVVLVAVPACGQRRAIEDRRYPREMYWDPLARAVAPAPAIRCYDVPALMDFTCADGSHLDAADARRFTRELARIVVDRLR
jgi:hypothetical protein